jgi:Holliday junction DNA helicase RuvA
MIYSLKGIVTYIGEDDLVVEVNGVGYQVFGNSRLLANAAVGEAVQIFIYTHVREDQFSLYGFSNIEERACFMQLTTVSGVGAKVGQAILAVLTPGEVAEAILTQNPTLFTRASGVGKKLAERIVLELKGKAAPTSNVVNLNATKPATSAGQDVVSALQNMGFKPGEAQAGLGVALKAVGAEAGFGELLKESLKALCK